MFIIESTWQNKNNLSFCNSVHVSGNIFYCKLISDKLLIFCNRNDLNECQRSVDSYKTSEIYIRIEIRFVHTDSMINLSQWYSRTYTDQIDNLISATFEYNNFVDLLFAVNREVKKLNFEKLLVKSIRKGSFGKFSSSRLITLRFRKGIYRTEENLNCVVYAMNAEIKIVQIP